MITNSTLPLISVIMPNYNYGTFLSEAIDSVLSQSYSNIECIVVDDGSTDNSVEIVENYIKKDSRVKLVTKINGGMSSARNEGIKKVTGDLVAFMDSDDLWEVDKLKHQYETIKQKNADVTFSDSVYFNAKGHITTEKFDNRELTCYDFLGSNPIPGCSSSVLMKKDIFTVVGFFNIDMRGSEDLEFLFRVAFYKFKFLGTPHVDVKIRKHSEGMQKDFLRMYIYKMYCFDKCLQLISQSDEPLDKLKFETAVKKRFQSMLWTARDCKRPDLIKYCYIRAKQLLGFKFYFSSLYLKNLKYDITLAFANRKAKPELR